MKGKELLAANHKLARLCHTVKHGGGGRAKQQLFGALLLHQSNSTHTLTGARGGIE